MIKYTDCLNCVYNSGHETKTRSNEDGRLLSFNVGCEKVNGFIEMEISDNKKYINNCPLENKEETKILLGTCESCLSSVFFDKGKIIPVCDCYKTKKFNIIYNL
jgi:hypothetical protein